MKRLEHHFLGLSAALWRCWGVFLGVGAAAIGYTYAPDDLLLRVIFTFFAFVWALLLIVGKANEQAKLRYALAKAQEHNPDSVDTLDETDGVLFDGFDENDRPLWIVQDRPYDQERDS